MGRLPLSSAQNVSATPQLVEQPVLGIDLAAQHGSYLGYGIGIHAGDLIYPKAFDELKPRFVRMEFGPDWDKLDEPIPSSASVGEFLDYITRNYNADAHDRLMGARYSNEFLQKRGTKIIQILFEIPYAWRTRDERSQVKPQHIEDLARFHTAYLPLSPIRWSPATLHGAFESARRLLERLYLTSRLQSPSAPLR